MTNLFGLSLDLSFRKNGWKAGEGKILADCEGYDGWRTAEGAVDASAVADA